MKIIIQKQLPLEAKKIREDVFVKEQGFKVEFDEIDNICYHLILTYGDTALATGRLYQGEEENCYILGRIAVVKCGRGKNYGQQVVLALENKAKELGATKIKISAQCQAQKFYEKLGYVAYGEEYLDEHCPHIDMYKMI